MKYIRTSLLVILLLFIQSFTIANSEIKIAIINMKVLVDKSVVGKSIQNQLNKNNKINIGYFKSKEKELKLNEEKLIAQKNVISKEEYGKKIIILKKKINEYRKDKVSRIDKLNNQKISALAKLLKEISPLLTKYSKDNNISIILDNKNIVVGKTELNITDDILKILDNKIKKIDIK